MPMLALHAPGARLTKQTPGRPVSLPYALAMNAAPPSWRQVMRRIDCCAVVEGIKRAEIALARHAEHRAGTLLDEGIDQNATAAALWCCTFRQ